MWLLLDVGNSTLDVALWRNGAFARREKVSMDRVESALAHFFDRDEPSFRSRIEEILLCSVNPPMARKVQAWVEQAFPRPALRLREEVPIPISMEVSSPDEVGTDRLLIGLGAFGETGSAVATIGFGTAVTVDLVDAGGVFRGGAIFPGPRVMARALHRECALLPQVAPSLPIAPVGKDTEEAVRTGVAAAVAGGIRSLLEQYARQLGATPRILATGGEAVRFAPLIPLFVEVDPDLLFKGMIRAYERYRES